MRQTWIHEMGPTVMGQASWLQGWVEVPFWVVGLMVGVVVCAGLVYQARRAARDHDDQQSGRERRERDER